ncbi:hypothetical protein UFOVP353_15 [uncultured Caudovirales phage]|uniref:Uncharacterized protein n=1 Tax=uncultured Caudovirales phage TaxID=2100421 RepID=A0A6J5M2Y6_9CAUD|nr:hypothetical protein UFOVP353_15 [uncultured Caudovirales phage]
MLKIKNWSSHQSYKDRTPPWIRLHRSLLDDFEFHSMSANARALLPMLWLLASEDKDPVSGSLRIGYERIAFRLRMDIKTVADGINEILSVTGDDGEAKFLELLQPIENKECNETVTNPYPIRNQTVAPETETETETETEIGTGGNLKRITSLPDLEKNQLNGHYQLWFEENCPQIDRFGIREELVLYCRSKGKKYSDYWATMQTWARRRQKQLAENKPKNTSRSLEDMKKLMGVAHV